MFDMASGQHRFTETELGEGFAGSLPP